MRPVGSPPRAWGARPSSRGPSWTATVHPHARGEHVAYGHSAVGAYGSPPRAWGALVTGRAGHFQGRFTPTRVGSTNSRVSTIAGHTVHPHARGEHDGNGTSCLGCYGSPPRAWGALRLDVAVAVNGGSPPRAWGARSRGRGKGRPVRFTPTRVGSTMVIGHAYGGRPVHPHARGSTRRQTRRSTLFPVHPHARGEHSVWSSNMPL